MVLVEGSGAPGRPKVPVRFRRLAFPLYRDEATRRTIRRLSANQRNGFVLDGIWIDLLDVDRARSELRGRTEEAASDLGTLDWKETVVSQAQDLIDHAA
jgi:hypothetical protein